MDALRFLPDEIVELPDIAVEFFRFLLGLDENAELVHLVAFLRSHALTSGDILRANWQRIVAATGRAVSAARCGPRGK